MLKIGDYVQLINGKYFNDDSVIDEYKDVFGIIVSFDNKDNNSPLTIDILNLENGKVYKACNPYYFEKKELPEEYLGAYQKLIQDGLYAKITKYFDFEVFKKISYNEEVYFNPIMDELRKQQCLCLNCASMTEDKKTNCSKANALYELCVTNNMAMMVTRCKEFEFKRVIHEMLIAPEYFHLVAKGEKTYEVRTNDARRKAMHIGDYIKLIKQPDCIESIMLEIVDKIEFPNFTILYDRLPKKLVGFEGKTTQEIVNELRKFYTEEQENEHGVVALELKVVGEPINENSFVKKMNKKNSSVK